MSLPEEIAFSVPGHPAAQGSKNQFGGEMNKRLKPWRNDVAVAASRVMTTPPFDGPVALRAVFIFPRPKNHYGTGRNAGRVKETAPGWKNGTPDLDKLLRALGDAITGVVVRDDAQLVDIHATKIWGQNPGVTVEVRPLA